MPYTLSLVIPVYNERENIASIFAEIRNSLSGYSHEIILVDDGSTDGSTQEIERLTEKNNNVLAILLARNYGQTAALAAGFKEARGDIIISLDGDGQNDPGDIPQMMEKIEGGCDVVSGWRRQRKDPFFSRRLPSILANRIISQVTGLHLHDYGCTLKAYRRSVLADLRLYGEMHRLLPAWCAWRGARIFEIEVNHRPRIHGESKYGIGRTFKVLFDLLTAKFFSAYMNNPSYLFGGLGLALYGVSALSTAVVFYDKFGPNRWPPFRIPLLLLSVLCFIVATLFIILGLLAELIVRVYYEVSGKNPFQIRSTLRSTNFSSL